MEAPRTLRRFVRRVVMSRQDVVPFCSPPFAGFLSLSNNPGHLQTDLEQVRSYILSRSHATSCPVALLPQLLTQVQASFTEATPRQQESRGQILNPSKFPFATYTV